MMVDGAVSGASDGAIRAIAQGRYSDILSDTISGFAGGAIMSPVIGGGMRIATKAGTTVLNKFNNKLTLSNVLPDGTSTKFSQGEVGDCALLSIFDGILGNKNTAKQLKESIMTNANGDYSVCIGDEIVKVARDSLSDEALSDTTGVRIIESAYKQLMGVDSLDGGFADVVAKQFGMNPVHINSDTISDEVLGKIQKEISEGNAILSLGMKVDTDGVIDPNGTIQHYFSIKGIDTDSKMITVVDTYDTSKIINIPLENVKTSGVSIDGGTIKTTELPNVARSADETMFFGRNIVGNSDSLSRACKELQIERFQQNGIPLTYSRQRYVGDLTNILYSTNRQERHAILDKMNISLIKDGQGRIIGYDGIIDLSRLDCSNPREGMIYNASMSFLYKNRVNLGDSSAATQLNGLLREMPEFVNLIGKQQHSTQRYSVDIHTLKVLQNLTEHPTFSKLSPNEQTILKYAALMHDIGKKQGVITPDHPQISAKSAQRILQSYDIDRGTQNRILNLIQNHEWFGLYSTGQLKTDDIARMFRNDPSQLRLAAMFSAADIKAIDDLSTPKTQSWYNSLKSFFAGNNQSKSNSSQTASSFLERISLPKKSRQLTRGNCYFLKNADTITLNGNERVCAGNYSFKLNDILSEHPDGQYILGRQNFAGNVDQTVSKKHLMVTKSGGKYTVQNLSQYGTGILDVSLDLDQIPMSNRIVAGRTKDGTLKSILGCLTPEQEAIYQDSYREFLFRKRINGIKYKASSDITTDHLIHGTSISGLLCDNGILDCGLMSKELIDAKGSAGRVVNGKRVLADTMSPLCVDTWKVTKNTTINEYFNPRSSHWATNAGESGFLFTQGSNRTDRVVLIINKSGMGKTLSENSFELNQNGKSPLFANGVMSNIEEPIRNINGQIVGYRRGHNYPTHTVVPIGIPSNAIEKIILNSPTQSGLTELIKKIQSCGLYTNIYDNYGRLLYDGTSKRIVQKVG